MCERVWVDGWGVVDLRSGVSDYGRGDRMGGMVEVELGSSHGGNSSGGSKDHGHDPEANTTGGNAHDDTHCDGLGWLGWS